MLIKFEIFIVKFSYVPGYISVTSGNLFWYSKMKYAIYSAVKL